MVRTSLFTLTVVLCMAASAFALPPPYSDAELEEAATLIVLAQVTEVECVGPPLVLETGSGNKTVTTYRSTLSVISTEKGTAPTPLTVEGTTSSWSPGSNPPIGGWSQPALKPGLKGIFYLELSGYSGDMNYAYVWWNALKEADSSVPTDLPDCTNECAPQCDSDSCGDDGCGGTCGECDDGECIEGECIWIEENCCESKECGDDGCGGHCGYCPEGQFCNEKGECKLDCAPSCVDDGGQALTCGDDGCGGSCGDCADGEECTNGLCTKNACDPICTDVSCGDDGCGGSCGECAEGETCGEDGQCSTGPCEPVTVPGKVMCGEHECNGNWGNCPDGLVCGEQNTCEDDIKTGSKASSGCRTGDGPINAGLALVFSLALLALVTRTRRESAAHPHK